MWSWLKGLTNKLKSPPNCGRLDQSLQWPCWVLSTLRCWLGSGVPSGLGISALHSLCCRAWDFPAFLTCLALIWTATGLLICSEGKQNQSPLLGSPLWVLTAWSVWLWSGFPCLSAFVWFPVLDVDSSWAWRKWSLTITSSPGDHVSPALSLTSYFQEEQSTGESLLSQSYRSKWIIVVDNHLSFLKKYALSLLWGWNRNCSLHSLRTTPSGSGC